MSLLHTLKGMQTYNCCYIHVQEILFLSRLADTDFFVIHVRAYAYIQTYIYIYDCICMHAYIFVYMCKNIHFYMYMYTLVIIWATKTSPRHYIHICICKHMLLFWPQEILLVTIYMYMCTHDLIRATNFSLSRQRRMRGFYINMYIYARIHTHIYTNACVCIDVYRYIYMCIIILVWGGSD